MKLKISYDPDSDTLDIGNGQPGSDGQLIADRLTAFLDANEKIVSITLEDAAELLAPYLSGYMAARDPLATASVLQDDGEPS